MRARTAVAALALLVALVPVGAQADHGGATVEWTALLPPTPALGDASDPAARCGSDGLVCLRDVERRLDRLAQRLGCDHRAVFATTYHLLTRELRREVERAPESFDDAAGIGLLAAVFYEMYVRTLASHAAGKPVPAAWQIALDAAAHGDHNAGQDMVLAISAHVQRDMPFAIAAVGLRAPDATSRKADHDAVNRVLSRAYDEIVPTIAQRYDPFMATVDASPSPLDDVAAGGLVAGWREHVWRNAEHLTAATTPAHRAMVERWIGGNAEGWARAVAAPQTPGYRAVRDAWCARWLADRR